MRLKPWAAPIAGCEVIDLGSVITQLESTPVVLRALLGGYPESRVMRRYGPESFSPYHVVGHLIIGERHDWLPRVMHILEHGDRRPFEPFGHESTIDPASGRSLGELLDEFASLRGEGVGVLRETSLNEQALAFKGSHPGLGEVTLAQLLSTWAVHDLHHIAQICKGLACGAGDDVGPWAAYLGILRTT